MGRGPHRNRRGPAHWTPPPSPIPTHPRPLLSHKENSTSKRKLKGRRERKGDTGGHTAERGRVSRNGGGGELELGHVALTPLAVVAFPGEAARGGRRRRCFFSGGRHRLPARRLRGHPSRPPPLPLGFSRIPNRRKPPPPPTTSLVVLLGARAHGTAALVGFGDRAPLAYLVWSDQCSAALS